MSTVAVVANVGPNGDTYRVVNDGESAITTAPGGRYSCVAVVDESEIESAVNIMEDKFSCTLTEAHNA